MSWIEYRFVLRLRFCGYGYGMAVMVLWLLIWFLDGFGGGYGYCYGYDDYRCGCGYMVMAIMVMCDVHYDYCFARFYRPRTVYNYCTYKSFDCSAKPRSSITTIL